MSTGICFIQLILRCKSIYDMARGKPLLNGNYTQFYLFSGVCVFSNYDNWSHRYHEADMRTGEATYWQLTSLQAFWPGLQVRWSWTPYIGWCHTILWNVYFFCFFMNRHFLEMLLLQICHTVNFTMYGKDLVYYLKGIVDPFLNLKLSILLIIHVSMADIIQ